MNFKRVLLFGVLLFISVLSYSQTEKGKWMVGGNAQISFARSTYYNTLGSKNYQRSFGVTVSPNVGYFFLPKFVAGLSTSYAYSKRKEGSDDISFRTTNKNYDFGLGVFSRYYFTFGKFGAFPEISIYNNFSKRKWLVLNPYSNELVEEKNKSSQLRFYPAVGLSYFITENVGLEGKLQYSREKEIDESGGFENKSLAFKVGFQVYL